MQAMNPAVVSSRIRQPCSCPYGIPGRARTCNQMYRRPMRYPVAPRGCIKSYSNLPRSYYASGAWPSSCRLNNAIGSGHERNLSCKACGPTQLGERWQPKLGADGTVSNLRPLAYKASALPSELHQQKISPAFYASRVGVRFHCASNRQAFV